MLILSRKPGEQIVFPECEVVVRVLGIKGKNVRLGISAPAEVPIHREEVWHQVRSATPGIPVQGQDVPAEGETSGIDQKLAPRRPRFRRLREDSPEPEEAAVSPPDEPPILVP